MWKRKLKKSAKENKNHDRTKSTNLSTIIKYYYIYVGYETFFSVKRCKNYAVIGYTFDNQHKKQKLKVCLSDKHLTSPLRDSSIISNKSKKFVISCGHSAYIYSNNFSYLNLLQLLIPFAKKINTLLKYKCVCYNIMNFCHLYIYIYKKIIQKKISEEKTFSLLRIYI